MAAWPGCWRSAGPCSAKARCRRGSPWPLAHRSLSLEPMRSRFASRTVEGGRHFPWRQMAECREQRLRRDVVALDLEGVLDDHPGQRGRLAPQATFLRPGGCQRRRADTRRDRDAWPSSIELGKGVRGEPSAGSDWALPAGDPCPELIDPARTDASLGGSSSAPSNAGRRSGPVNSRGVVAEGDRLRSWTRFQGWLRSASASFCSDAGLIADFEPDALSVNSGSPPPTSTIRRRSWRSTT